VTAFRWGGLDAEKTEESDRSSIISLNPYRIAGIFGSARVTSQSHGWCDAELPARPGAFYKAGVSSSSELMASVHRMDAASGFRAQDAARVRRGKPWPSSAASGWLAESRWSMSITPLLTADLSL
jgi:hypothetical protein